jgi:hypothetical protein
MLRGVPADPTGYWMSEKLDGVRAYWDGKRLISRQGNVFAVPAWFTERFPDFALDGELSMGPGTFNLTSGVVRRRQPHEGWRKLAYHVFDAPAHPGPYEKRQKFLEREVARAKSEFLRKTPVEKIRSRAHLERRLAQVLEAGGEGLVVTRPGSQYTPRRTDCIVKGATAPGAHRQKAPGRSRKPKSSSKRRPSRSQKRRAATKRRLTSLLRSLDEVLRLLVGAFEAIEGVVEVALGDPVGDFATKIGQVFGGL